MRPLRWPIVAALGLSLAACGSGSDPGMRMIVLGIDGMDYDFTRELIEAGRMPNFARQIVIHAVDAEHNHPHTGIGATATGRQ